MQLRFLLAAAVFLGLAGPVPAQQVDPADITFWQSIQSSQNPAEYSAYLASFPKGVFAELARLRIAQLGGQAAPQPDAATATGGQPAARAGATPALGAAPAEDQPLSDASLSIEPAAPRVGQSIKVRFADMPSPSSYDTAIIVAAGSPASTGTTSDENVLKKTYVANQYYLDNGWEVGSLPPGSYEVRWLTSLYNTASRLEVGAKFAFQVAR